MAKGTFDSAPSGTGGFRGISRQIAGVIGGASFLGGKKGADYKQQSALLNQQHTQNVQRDVMKHVLGESAADTAHQRTLRQGRQTHKLSQAAADAAHQRDIAGATHLVDHFERMGSSGQFSNLNVGSKGVSGTFRAPAKDTSSESSPTGNTNSSGSVSLD